MSLFSKSCKSSFLNNIMFHKVKDLAEYELNNYPNMFAIRSQYLISC